MAADDFNHVREALKDVDFPADKGELLDHARQRGADQVAIKLLRGLPPETYDNMGEIRSSVSINEAAEDGQTPARKAEQSRSAHSHRIAEYLRD
jgi:hypothetical protein